MACAYRPLGKQGAVARPFPTRRASMDVEALKTLRSCVYQRYQRFFLEKIEEFMVVLWKRAVS